jgi:hypothetical protein
LSEYYKTGKNDTLYIVANFAVSIEWSEKSAKLITDWKNCSRSPFFTVNWAPE